MAPWGKRVGEKNPSGESQAGLLSLPLPPPSHLPPAPQRGKAGGQGACAFIWALLSLAIGLTTRGLCLASPEMERISSRDS